MSNENAVTLRQEQEFRFVIDFGGGLPALRGDEAPPLGGGTGPTPVQLLAAAVGNCLCESFCTVAQSVGQGIPIDVSVCDGAGVKLK
jgi:uncharacterized OsmC-like protein